MREERTLTATRFISLLSNYVWLASQYYNPDHLRNVIIPKVSGIQEKVLRISSFSYGLIASGWYDRAYLSELSTMINDFVRDYEEILDADLSDEEKFSKLEAHLYSFELRLAVLEYEVMKDYIVKTLEEYLQAHRSVLGKDFSLKDLFRILKRLVDDEDEESPLTS